MTHELKEIVAAYLNAKERGVRTVMATVVDLDGSSYRKPGVRMLLCEDGSMVGAVSGGCVEKDIARQAEQVFSSGKPLMMTYDGRYRLGCEGVLYILVEPFQPDEHFLETFSEAIAHRISLKLTAHYQKEEGFFDGLGTTISIGDREFGCTAHSAKKESGHQLRTFEQTLPPCFKLMIFGAEHDAVTLCRLASFHGWEVTIVAGPLEQKTIDNFPGATSFYSVAPDAMELDRIDAQTAVMIMSHNFANDLKFLIELKDATPAYIGLLGPSKRREKLFSELIEHFPDLDVSFPERIHGPAGLNIGAETPQEIATAIISEILTVVRDKQPILLREKQGGIHA
ncbi:MAG: XdhC family protein [Bacteroidota bacterium]